MLFESQNYASFIPIFFLKIVSIKIVLDINYKLVSKRNLIAFSSKTPCCSYMVDLG